MQRQNFGARVIRGALLTFLPTYSLHNHLLESPRYIAYIISTILVMLIGYGFLTFNWNK